MKAWTAAALAVLISSGSALQVPPYKNPSLPIEQRAADLLGRMTLDEKIGQMTQVDRQFLKPEADIETYFLGSLLSGGGSAPAEEFLFDSAPETEEAGVAVAAGYQTFAARLTEL